MKFFAVCALALATSIQKTFDAPEVEQEVEMPEEMDAETGSAWTTCDASRGGRISPSEWTKCGTKVAAACKVNSAAGKALTASTFKPYSATGTNGLDQRQFAAFLAKMNALSCLASVNQLTFGIHGKVVAYKGTRSYAQALAEAETWIKANPKYNIATWDRKTGAFWTQDLNKHGSVVNDLKKYDRVTFAGITNM